MTSPDVTLVVMEYHAPSGNQKIHDTFYHAKSSNPEEKEESGILAPGVHPPNLATAIFEKFGGRNVSVLNLRVPCERRNFPQEFQTRKFIGYTPLLGQWTQEHLRELFPQSVVVNYVNGEA